MNKETWDKVTENVMAINEWCKEFYKNRIAKIERSMFVKYQLYYLDTPHTIIIDENSIRISYGYGCYLAPYGGVKKNKYNSDSDLCIHGMGLELVLHWKEVKESIEQTCLEMENKYNTVMNFKI